LRPPARALVAAAPVGPASMTVRSLRSRHDGLDGPVERLGLIVDRPPQQAGGRAITTESSGSRAAFSHTGLLVRWSLVPLSGFALIVTNIYLSIEGQYHAAHGLPRALEAQTATWPTQLRDEGEENVIGRRGTAGVLRRRHQRPSHANHQHAGSRHHRSCTGNMRVAARNRLTGDTAAPSCWSIKQNTRA
jgi:hypothetical protein